MKKISRRQKLFFVVCFVLGITAMKYLGKFSMMVYLGGVLSIDVLS
jgi:hypothetical protein